MNGKQAVKSIVFSCLALIWMVNTAVASAPGFEAAPWSGWPQSVSVPQRLPSASSESDSQSAMQEMGSPSTLAYSWTKNWGHISGEASTMGLAVDRWGNLYITGQFSGTVNFDPAGANPNATFTSYNSTVDAYLLKLDANGRYQWAKTWGAGFADTYCPFTNWGCGRDAASGVTVDA